MPGDNMNKTKSKGLSQHPARQHSTTSGTGTKYDSDTDGVLPSAIRFRLHDLFSQIEKEFESVYLENLNLQEKVESLQERLDTFSAGEKPMTDSLDVPEGVAKPKRSASHLSQKIKTTYKASTSKIVSSFRQTTPAYSLVKTYRGHKDGVWEVSVSKHDNRYIGTASADHSAQIWNIESGQCVLQYLGHQGSVNAVRFNPSQDLVVTSSGDQTAHIWRPNITATTHEINRSHSSGEDEVDVSEKEDTGEEFIDQNAISLRLPLRELTGHTSVVISADWLPTGDQVITASWDRTAILFDAESGEQLTVLAGHDQELTEVRAHLTQSLVVTSSKDTTFRLWDFRDPNMPVTVFQGHTQPVTTAMFAQQEKVVSGSDDRTVKVWDLKNMRSPIATIRTDAPVNRLSVSPNQNIIAIPLDNRNIRLYDMNGNRMGRLPKSNRIGHGKMVCSTAWAEDNPVCNLFSCGFDRQVLGWHVNVHTKE